MIVAEERLEYMLGGDAKNQSRGKLGIQRETVQCNTLRICQTLKWIQVQTILDSYLTEVFLASVKLIHSV